MFIKGWGPWGPGWMVLAGGNRTGTGRNRTGRIQEVENRLGQDGLDWSRNGAGTGWDRSGLEFGLAAGWQNTGTNK